jgi:ubiquinone biosynthesis protein
VIAPIDFGMIGILDEETVDQLSMVFTAIVDRDAKALANLLLRTGREAEPVQAGPMRLELSDLFERYYDVPLRQLNMKDIASNVTGIFRRYKLHFPQELVTVVRALMMVENIGRGLYPEFNVFEFMKPFAAKLMIRRSDPITRVQDFAKSVEESSVLLKTLPSDIRDILRKIKRDELAIRFEHRGLERMNLALDRSSNRLSFAVVIAALIIGSSIVFQTGLGPRVVDYPIPGLAGFLLASILGLWLLIGIMRSGHL